MAAATFRLFSHALLRMMILEIGGRNIGHSPVKRPSGTGGDVRNGSKMHGDMTLYQIGGLYRNSAEPLRRRLKELRAALKTATDPEEVWRLKRRIAELTPMLSECNALAVLCERYYERGYYRDERYTL